VAADDLRNWDEVSVVHKVAVIGLGRFGRTLAKELGAAGVQVIALDRNPHLVEEVKDDVDVAVRLDSTDQEALQSQRIQDVDICVIAIGENFEAAILTTVIIKKMGIPRIICRARSATHAEIFSRIGADEIIQPETQAGILLGRKLANPQLDQFIQLADGYSLIELRAPKQFQGKTLEQLGLRTKYQVNLVAVKRPILEKNKNGTITRRETIISVPRPGDIIEPEDTLVLAGNHDALSSLPHE
jgi:trk system potassium uptake protein TrkA